MSDNLSKDSCEREIIPYLDLPVEVFTDIFAFLPRRTLVQRVQPVNKAFKAICDKHVKTVHVIKGVGMFFGKLKAGDPGANQHVEDLAGHNCALAGQFVFWENVYGLWIYINNGDSQAIQTVLRHSLDLFQQCQIWIVCLQLVSAEHLAYLTIFEQAKPVFLHFQIRPKSSTEASLSTLLRHPTILNCSRLALFPWVWAQDHCQPIFDWLHHNPMDIGLNMGEKDKSSASCIDVVDQQQHQPDIRALILYDCCFDAKLEQTIERMLERCVQHLQQSQKPSDRRHFLLSFCCFDRTNELQNRFASTENPSTGEVLLLEHVVDDGGDVFYRLVRCLASQIAKDGTEELYAKLFKSLEAEAFEPEQFNIGDEHGKEPLKVFIEEEEQERMYCYCQMFGD